MHERIAPLCIDIYINPDGSVTFADLAEEAVGMAVRLKGEDILLGKEDSDEKIQP